MVILKGCLQVDYSMYIEYFSMLLARLRGLLKGCLSIHICIFLYISVTRHIFQLWSQEMQFFLARFVLGDKDNYFSGKLQSSSCVMSPCAPGRKESCCPTACLSLRALLGQIHGLVSAVAAWAERLWSCLFTSGCEEHTVSVCLLFFHFGIYSGVGSPGQTRSQFISEMEVSEPCRTQAAFFASAFHILSALDIPTDGITSLSGTRASKCDCQTKGISS